MTLDEFRSLNLDETSGPLAILLTGHSQPLQPVTLRPPLPVSDTSRLLYAQHIAETRSVRLIFEFSYPTGKYIYIHSGVRLEHVESIVGLPRIYRRMPTT
ncbi:hypothetical protein BN8_03205 [Fibrisoma limi BUZ 3]|uniref:Uncharacterized protein n=1 Tax=Fibrisoma limi BUZ 3 TaxID=1185876 RepID=I2GJI9_9BACT|nr:hypothetical protein [Fibrisoma limi]CCH54064.1 hypothetical protein BN8_03205 [Fibrisoma limi BUZ 3]